MGSYFSRLSAHLRKTAGEEPSPIGCSTFDFDLLPTELKLYVLTFVPYESLYTCLQVNHCMYHIVSSNWKNMRNLGVKSKRISFTMGSIFSDINPYKEKSCLIVKDNRDFSVDMKEGIAHFETSEAKFRNFFSNLHKKHGYDYDSTILDHLNVYEYDLPITSLEQGFMYYMEQICKKWNNNKLEIYGFHANSSTHGNYYSILSKTMLKHKNRLHEIHLQHAIINSTIFDIINSSYSRKVTFDRCEFEDNNLLSLLGDHFEFLDIALWEPANDLIGTMLEGFLQQWTRGGFKKFRKLTWVFIEKEKFFYEGCIKRVFGKSLIAAKEMNITSADGKKLNLLFDHSKVSRRRSNFIFSVQQ